MKPILFNTEMVRTILDGRKTVTRRLVKPQHLIGILPDKCKNGLPENFLKEKKLMFKPYCDMTDKELVKTAYQPPCQSGDILYVRETWCDDRQFTHDDTPGQYFYRADNIFLNAKWRPSIHMPKEAARIFLKVTDVRAERLQDITEAQAKAEGICRLYDDMSKEEYLKWAKRVGQMETQEQCLYKNYLWHGNFGKYGTGNRLSDAWEYQYSGYSSAVSSFSSLWNATVELKDWTYYGWAGNPWVWVIEFERCEEPKED